jgi:tetratricopeptide (TPR) repeat protein
VFSSIILGVLIFPGVISCPESAYAQPTEGTGSLHALEKAVEKEPSDLVKRKELAQLYLHSGLLDKSIEQYEEIIRYDPDDLNAKESLAFQYMWASRPAKARVLLEKVLEIEPRRKKAREALEHLKKLKPSHHEKAAKAGHVNKLIKNNAEQLDTFNKLADSYLHEGLYLKAREYYENLLKLDPGNIHVQRKLDEIERMMSPQVFTQIDLYEAKGDSKHMVQTYGGSIFLEDGYRMETEYTIKRRTQRDSDRYVRQSGRMEFSKAFKDHLVLFSGATFKYYDDNEAGELDYFVRALKSFRNGTSINFTYEKERQDAKHEILEQNVDRHGFTLGIDHNLNEHLSFSSVVEGDYYTKGYAPDNNASVSLSASPVFHIVKGQPYLDISYTYHRMDFLRKSETRNGIEYDYEYYSPKWLEMHAGTVYLSYELFAKRLKLVFSDTLSYRVDNNVTHNVIYAELRWKITPSDSLSGVFVRSRAIRHVGDSFQMTEQYTIKFSHRF